MVSQTSLYHLTLRQHGTSLLECLVASVLLSLCVISTTSLLANAVRQHSLAELNYTIATAVAERKSVDEMPAKFARFELDELGSRIYCRAFGTGPFQHWRFSWLMANH